MAQHFRQDRPTGRGGPRILIYSHDTFGLGHLRRCRAIANRLAGSMDDASIVIISGSPIIGRFDFEDGVDYVRVPGVVKLPNGGYTTSNLRLSLDETVQIRRSVIMATARSLNPDLIIVDKEPAGFRDELLPTLEHLKATGARIVLGLRDVLDDAAVIVPEWERKGATEALSAFYDNVWVYGLPEIHEPLAPFALPERLQNEIIYTGYLRRDLPQVSATAAYPSIMRKPYVLVTTGGGGDGEGLIDWTLSAYEADRSLPLGALIVFGPFVPPEQRAAFMERVARLPDVEAITFDSRIEHLIANSEGVIAMGGYNTFCEILSFDKRSVIVPRRTPRMEQTIRAERAAELGLISCLDGAGLEDGAHRNPHLMAEAIRALPGRPKPSEKTLPRLLDGLDTIDATVRGWFSSPSEETARTASR
ncbi:Predicted glycosyl transferase [Aureimonas altamirensis DSM 21988]|uniref:Predicted glycosyl transferase n=2 Tax=Aureimonas altamirensis TaxID=370622 RepID=A0ABY1I8N2_9HYPH|nr:glycosyltransferase [Aureimonas altamirensis]BAT25946.1 putative glycosyl transferase [Aureimonas altamirensis]SHI76671.1 Predicted glycosyl transferase [Aureimonas altamirensis DSM 21988]